MSRDGNSNLLAFPKLCSGKGVNAANAVIQCLKDCTLTNDIKVMSFDNTLNNTGNKQGTITFSTGLLASY